MNYLSDIDFSESIIVESIKELSSNSAAGPDGFPSSWLINCSDILAPIVCTHSEHRGTEYVKVPKFLQDPREVTSLGDLPERRRRRRRNEFY